MAEQSIGMTTGNGDGVAGGYPAARMLLMETGTLNNGVMQYGNLLALSGSGTGNLTINDGAAIVGGYYYENTTSATIPVAGVAGTYYAVIYVNASAATPSVFKVVGGGTTVAAWTVRLALVSALPGVPYLLLGTVVTNGVSITTLTPAYTAYAETRQLPYQVAATMTGGTATLTTANTQYDVTGYSSSDVTTDGTLAVNTTTGLITVKRAGWYVVTAFATYTNGTTGNRNIVINASSSGVLARTATTAATATTFANASVIYKLAANETVNISSSSTLAAQNVTTATLTVARA